VISEDKIMKFFLGCIALFFINCSEKKETISLCERGIDSLLQSSYLSYNFHNTYDTWNTSRYVDWYCLDSESALFYRIHKLRQVFEYGNFKKGYYAVDSLVLPAEYFETFANYRQIEIADSLQALEIALNPPGPSRMEGWMYQRLVEYGGLISIYPYKDRIFGLDQWGVIEIDVNEKSLEPLMYYKLVSLFNDFSKLKQHPYPYFKEGDLRAWRSDSIYKDSRPYDLIRMRNDTLVISYRPSPIYIDSLFIDTILITLDGNSVIPKIGDNRCLEVRLKNGKEYIGASCPIEPIIREDKFVPPVLPRPRVRSEKE
jgi:hypothetical protein